jgi:DNA-binding NarL/FixJ family response regulator
LALVGTTTSIGATLDAIRTNTVDAPLFDYEWAHPMKSIRASLSAKAFPPFIAVHEQASRAAMVHALACGFDGLVGTSDGSGAIINKIERIVDGTWSFESEPWLREIGLSRGLLARELELSEDDDEQLVDLVGTGLPDEDIALLMDWSIQRVRNRIENLLSNNQLSYRTQLAVIRAASLKVPDFS